MKVRQVVPFLFVTDMQRSLRFYVDGLGFEVKIRWEPDGHLRWCWMTIGDAAVMLQEFRADLRPEGTLGLGTSLCFMCDDAVAFYREFIARGIEASEPQVGNGLWVTSVTDPDGYRIDFESETDTPEETRLSELADLATDEHR